MTLSNAMAMQELINKNWDYILFQSEEDYIMEVVCGTVAIYTITFKLDETERAGFETEGERFLDHLAWKVRDYPEEYIKRRV
jgi:hypothetical protein